MLNHAKSIRSAVLDNIGSLLGLTTRYILGNTVE